MPRWAAVLMLTSWVAQSAAADAEGRWLILPVGSPSSEATERAAALLHEELAARGSDVWSPEDATARFEREGSSAPVRLSQAAERAWDNEADEVLKSLVRGDAESAYRRLTQSELLSLPLVTALNRNPKKARKVLDTCLLGVRAALELGEPRKAEATTRDCRRLVPAGEPSSYMHPPPVMKLLADVDEAATRSAALNVRSKPVGCATRLNGLPRGASPIDISRLIPGVYGVQVECLDGAPGRVHYVDLGAGFTRLEVDARFDAAVVTEPTLSLRYPDETAAKQHGVRDAKTIAAAVPAENLVVVTWSDREQLALVLLHGPSLVSSARAKLSYAKGGPERGDVALATEALTEHRCSDLTTVPPRDADCMNDSTQPGLEQQPRSARMPPPKFRAGLTLASVGAATLVTGYVLLAPRAQRANEWIGSLDMGLGGASSQQAWVNLGIWQIALASVGGASLVAGMPLVLPKRQKVPWWGWLAGGLGLGVAGLSIAYGVTAQSEPSTPCSETVTDPDEARMCVQRSTHINVAVLAGATSAALLTIPLVYLLRRGDARLAPEVQMSPEGGYVGLRGRF